MNTMPDSQTQPLRATRLREVAFALLLICAAASLLSVAVSQLALGASLLVFLVACLRGARPVRTGLEWPALLLLGWALLLIPFSPDRLDSLIHARRFYMFTALWLAAALVDSDRRRRLMFLAMAAAALINSLYSLLTEVILPQSYYDRIALLQHSTITGAWLLMAAALVIFAFIIRADRRRNGILLWLALLPILAAIVFTQTRSAWMGLFFGVALILWLTHRRYLLVMILVLVLATALAPQQYKSRVTSIGNISQRTNSQRVLLWKTGWDLIREHPLTGVGDRNLSDLAPPVYRNEVDREPVYLRHLHQNLIMLAVIWGIPGLLLALWFILKNLQLLFERWRRPGSSLNQSGTSTWVLAAMAVWMGVHVAGIFDWTFGDPEMSLFYMLCMGIGLSRS